MELNNLIDNEFWIFDLDNTLYPVSINLFDQIDKRMCSYIADMLKLSHSEAYKLQKKYFREHGTSLKGMMANHMIDPKPYLKYVHDIDFSAIKLDKLLLAALNRLPGKKIIFTNAEREYTKKVLDRLGILECIDGIFDIVAAGYIPKPERGAYEHIVSKYSINPEKAIMVEDIARNLSPAADMGMKTVWVKTERPWALADSDKVSPDFVIDNLSIWLAEVTEI